MPRQRTQRRGPRANPYPTGSSLHSLRLTASIQHAQYRSSLQSSSSPPPLSSQPPRTRSLYNIARRPLDPNKQYRDDLGPCDVICPNCGAFHWIARILTGEFKKRQSSLLAEYDNWQYFLAEFSQYSGSAKQVRFQALSQMLTIFLDIHITLIH